MSVTGATSLGGGGSSITEEPIIPSTELESGDTPTTEAQEGVEPTTKTVEGEQPEGGRPGEGEVREDGRHIPKWMEESQESNAGAYKKATTDLFDLEGRRSVHPTVQAAREEHDLVQSLGGKEGVGKLREQSGFYSEAANQFLKGDPAFVKDLWEEDKIAAALHVQPMLDAFRTNDFEGYRTTIARLQDQELQAVGFGPALKNLIDAVEKGDKETALNILVKGRDTQGNASNFVSWFYSVGEIARKAEDPRFTTILAERAKARDTEQQTQTNEFKVRSITLCIPAFYQDVEG